MKALLYYRSRLDEHDQQIYDQLVKKWMCFEEIIEIAHPHCAFSELTRAIHLDYPLMFYVNYHKITYMENNSKILIKGQYFYTKDKARLLLEQCEQWGRYIYQNIPSGMEKKEQALWLHDVILNNIKYGDINGMSAFHLIGVACEKMAVCEGIALAYKFLCDLAEIPCIYVSGKLNGHPHGWNMIWLEKGTSFIDVTNDFKEGGEYSRKNFLRSSKEMIAYEWDTDLIPECRVFNQSNTFVTVRNKKEMVDVMKNGMNQDSLSIAMNFDHLLTSEEIQELISFCILKNKELRNREITYSPERQILFIQK